MAFKNNNFSNDDPVTRVFRLHFLKLGIDDNAAVLGVTGDLLAWAQNCEKEWNDIYREAKFSRLEASSAFAECRRKQVELTAFYQKAKDLLKALIAESENPDEVMRAYSIDSWTPRTREGIETAVDDLIRQNAVFSAEGVEWVLPEHIIDEIQSLRDEMSALHTDAVTKRDRAKTALKARNKRFIEDTKRLKVIFQMAVLVWGVNSNDLSRIGMVRKSSIWTKRRPPTPENFAYDSDSRIFRWDAIEDVTAYEAHYREADEKGHWTAFYEGVENSCSPPDSLRGVFEFRVRAIAENKESHWSRVLEITFPGS